MAQIKGARGGSSDGGRVYSPPQTIADERKEANFYRAFQRGELDPNKITDSGWKSLYEYELRTGRKTAQDINPTEARRYNVDLSLSKPVETPSRLGSGIDYNIDVDPELGSSQEPEKRSLWDSFKSVFSFDQPQQSLQQRDRINPVTPDLNKTTPSLGSMFNQYNQNEQTTGMDPLTMALNSRSDTGLLNKYTQEVMDRVRQNGPGEVNLGEMFGSYKETDPNLMPKNPVTNPMGLNEVDKINETNPIKTYLDQSAQDVTMDNTYTPKGVTSYNKEADDKYLAGIQSFGREFVGKASDKSFVLEEDMSKKLADAMKENNPVKAEMIKKTYNKGGMPREYWDEDKLFNSFMGRPHDAEIPEGEQVSREIGAFAGSLAKILTFSKVLGMPSTTKGLLAKNVAMGTASGLDTANINDYDAEETIKEAVLGALSFGVGEMAGIGVTNKMGKALVHVYKANPTWANHLNALVRTARGLGDGTVGGMVYGLTATAMGRETQDTLKQAIQSGLIMGIVGAVTSYVPWSRFGITSEDEIKKFTVSVDPIDTEDALRQKGYVKLSEVEGANTSNPYVDDMWINNQTKDIKVVAVSEKGTLVPKSMVDGTTDLDMMDIVRNVEDTPVRKAVDPTTQPDYIDKTKQPSRYARVMEGFMERAGFKKNVVNGDVFFDKVQKNPMDPYDTMVERMTIPEAEKYFEDNYFTRTVTDRPIGGVEDMQSSRKPVVTDFDDSFEVNRAMTDSTQRAWIKDMQDKGYKEFKPGVWVKEVDGKITDVVPEFTADNQGRPIPVYRANNPNSNPNRTTVRGLTGGESSIADVPRPTNPHIEFDSLEEFVKKEYGGVRDIDENSFDMFRNSMDTISKTYESLYDATAIDYGKSAIEVLSDTNVKINQDVFDKIEDETMKEAISLVHGFLNKDHVQDAMEKVKSFDENSNPEEISEAIRKYNQEFIKTFITEESEADLEKMASQEADTEELATQVDQMVGEDVKTPVSEAESLKQDSDFIETPEVENVVDSPSIRAENFDIDLAKENYVNKITSGDRSVSPSQAQNLFNTRIKQFEDKDFEFVEKIMHKKGEANLELLSEYTGMPVETDEQIDQAIRSIDPQAYDSYKGVEVKPENVSSKNLGKSNTTVETAINNFATRLSGDSSMTFEASQELARSKIDDMENRNFESLVDSMHSGNPHSLTLLGLYTGMPTNNQANITKAIRSLDPKAYDKWEKETTEAYEKEKAEEEARTKREKEEEKAREEEERMDNASQSRHIYDGERLTLEELVDRAYSDGFRLNKINEYGGYEWTNGQGESLTYKKFNKDQKKYIRERYKEFDEAELKAEEQAEDEAVSNRTQDEQDIIDQFLGGKNTTFTGKKEDETVDTEETTGDSFLDWEDKNYERGYQKFFIDTRDSIIEGIKENDTTKRNMTYNFNEYDKDRNVKLIYSYVNSEIPRMGMEVDNYLERLMTEKELTRLSESIYDNMDEIVDIDIDDIDTDMLAEELGINELDYDMDEEIQKLKDSMLNRMWKIPDLNSMAESYEELGGADLDKLESVIRNADDIYNMYYAGKYEGSTDDWYGSMFDSDDANIRKQAQKNMDQIRRFLDRFETEVRDLRRDYDKVTPQQEVSTETTDEAETTKPTIKKPVIEEASGVGYHAGTLSTSKAEKYKQMVSSRRSTGHFGTGTYFVSDKEKFGDSSYSNKDIHEISFDGYKLFRPQNSQQAEQVHDVLKFINNYYSYIDIYDKVGEIALDDFSAELNDLWDRAERDRSLSKDIIDMVENSGLFTESEIEELGKHKGDIERYGHRAINIVNENSKWSGRLGRLGRDLELFKSDVHRIDGLEVEQALDLIREVYEEIKGNEDTQVDSPSTVFMKKLGYEGVDVRHIDNMDNTTYGSVIYDLKQEDIDKAKENLSEEVIETTEATTETTETTQTGNLSDYGLSIEEAETNNGNTVWEVSGDTKPYKDILGKNGLGGRWYGPKKVWSFTTKKFPTMESLENALLERITGESVEAKQTIEGVPEDVFTRAVDNVMENAPDDWQNNISKQRRIKQLLNDVTSDRRQTEAIFKYLLETPERQGGEAWTDLTDKTTESTGPIDITDEFFGALSGKKPVSELADKINGTSTNYEKPVIMINELMQDVSDQVHHVADVSIFDIIDSLKELGDISDLRNNETQKQYIQNALEDIVGEDNVDDVMGIMLNEIDYQNNANDPELTSFDHPSKDIFLKDVFKEINDEASDDQDGDNFVKYYSSEFARAINDENGSLGGISVQDLLTDTIARKDLFSGIENTMANRFGNNLYDMVMDKAKEMAYGEETPEIQTEANHRQSQEIADKVVEKLNKGEKMTYVELFDIANRAYGGTQANNDYSVKDAYDSLELGVNQYLLQQTDMDLSATDKETVISNIKKIQDLLKLLPTQTKRTREMIEYQQFSTPPNISYVANWIANISKGDTMLEPSAGIGGLAVFSKIHGANVVVNELSDRRLEILKNMPFEGFHNENAEHINNILPEDVKPTVVVMNPPFSATAGRLSKNKTKYATSHLEQALKRLEDGGRLVALVGNTMGEEYPQFTKWWSDIKKEYNVLANFTIDGKNYTKYGTSYDVNVLVIDKTGPTTGTTFTGKYDNLEDVVNDLEVVRDARQERAVQESTRGQQEQTEQVGGEDAESGTRTGSGERPVSDTTNAVGTRGTRSGSTRQGSSTRGTTVSGTTRPTTDSTVVDGEREGTDTGRTGSNQETRPDGNGTVRGTKDGVENVDVGIKNEAKKVSKDDDIDKVFADYTPSKLKIKGAKPHKGKLSESTAMSVVEPPNPNYSPSLPKKLIEDGELSDAQLEAIVYAGQSHEQILPNGERKGFFIGDGTGVGKGREIAGIIMDNYNKGRNKAVWISKNNDLYIDANRDLSDIGYDTENLFQLPKVGERIDQGEGVLFLGYGTLASGMNNSRYHVENINKENYKPKKQARIDQIVDWLGEDFDGVIAFDESHKMANATTVKGSRGNKKPSQNALSGLMLQKALPKARIVYVSATGASEVTNLAYLTRLGLWGEGTQFDGVNDFIDSIGAGGLASMELVARDMKAQGVYMSRGLSYDGVTYDRLEHALTQNQERAYDLMADAWQTVMQNMEKALIDNNSPGKVKGNARGQFWSSQQRFFNQILTSMTMPSVLDSIDKDLKNGNAVVIQLTNTNEAMQERQLAKAKENDVDIADLDMSPKDILIQYLMNAYPVELYEEVEDDSGNVTVRMVTDSNGKPVLNQDAVRERDRMVAMLGSINMPESPLDMIINRFGPKNVAEVTGRNRRIVRTTDAKGNEKVTEERRSERVRMKEVDDFNEGKTNILVFSEAGGTGKSYHASLDVKNQKRRIHYILQAGFNAMSAMQGLGRTHRTNQASAPHVKLVTTNIAGHKRFISTIARRLDQLGALTKGQRQAGTQGLFGEKDNLEGPVAKDSLHAFYKRLGTDSIAGLNRDEVLQKMGLYQYLIDEYGRMVSQSDVFTDVKKFLNRLLVLEPEMQDRVFEAYSDILDAMVERAIELGTLDVGLENFKADSVEVFDEKVIRTDEVTGAETKYMSFDVKQKRDLLLFDDLDLTSERFHGFYKNTRSGTVRAYFVSRSVTLDDGSIERSYRSIEPEADKRHRASESDFRKDTMEKVTEEEARKLWDEQLKAIPEYKESTIHLITGSILPIWKDMDFKDEKTRVIRVITNEGYEYLGRLLKEDNANFLLRKMGQQAKVKEIDTKGAIDRVMVDDEVIHFANGWRVKRSRVSGENRLELLGPSFTSMDFVEKAGAFYEVIQSQTRFFIPVSKAVEVIEKIAKSHPIKAIKENPNKNRIRGSILNREEQSTDGTPYNVLNNKKNSKPKPLSEIIKEMNKDFKTSVSSKRFRAKRGEVGQYNTHSEGIRVKKSQNIGTIAHELGHHLDKKYGMSESYEALLLKISPELGLSSKYSRAEIPGEVIAEYVKYYLMGHDRFNEIFDDLHQIVEETFDVNDLENLRKHKDQIMTWFNADIIEQIKSTTVSRTQRKRTSWEEKKTEWTVKLFDVYRPIQELVEQVELTTGQKIKFSDNPYVLAMQSNKAGMIALSQVFYAMSDIEGKEIDNSFMTVIGEIDTDDREDFDAYLKVSHAITLHDYDKQVFPDAIDIETQRRAKAELERRYPHFKRVAQNVYDWWSKFIEEWVVKSGFMDGGTWERMKEMYPTYVPNFRALEDDSRSGGTRRGFGNQSSPIKRMKGSDFNTYSAIENMIIYIDKVVKTQKRNEVGQAVHRLYSNVEGLGNFIERIDKESEYNRFDATRLKDRLIWRLAEDYGKSLKGEDRKKFNELKKQDNYSGMMQFLEGKGFLGADIVDDTIDDIMEFFTPRNFSTDSSVYTIIDKDGETYFYEVKDRYFLEAMLQMEEKQLDGVVRMLGGMKRVFTNLTTGANPIFGLFTNIWSDIPESWSYGSYKNPFEFGYEMVKSIGQVIESAGMKGKTLDEIGDSQVLKYRLMGGGMSSPISENRQLMTEMMNQLFPDRKRSSVKNALNWSISLIENFNETIETAPRLVEFNKVLKEQEKILQERGIDPDSYEGRLMASYYANEVTLNFQRRGSIHYTALGQAVPFLNAGLQGMRKLNEEFIRMKGTGKDDITGDGDGGFKRKRDWSRFGALLTKVLTAFTMVELLQMIAYRDDEDYEKLSEYTKDNYWLIKYAPGKFVKIRKSRELGLLFGSGFRRGVKAYTEGPEAFDGYWDSLQNVILPPNPMTDSLFAPLVSVASNKAWHGGDIIPMSIDMRQIDEHEKYDADTTELSKTVASVLHDYLGPDVSPMHLDYLVQQYSGFIGQIVIPAMSKNDTVVDSLGKRISADVRYSNNVISKFYDRKDELEKAYTEYNRDGVKSDDFNPVERYRYYKVGEEMSDLYRQVRELDANDTLTRDQKKEIEDGIRERMLVLADEKNLKPTAFDEFKVLYNKGQDLLTEFNKDGAKALNDFTKEEMILFQMYNSKPKGGKSMLGQPNYEMSQIDKRIKQVEEAPINEAQKRTAIEQLEKTKTKIAESFMNMYHKDINIDIENFFK